MSDVSTTWSAYLFGAEMVQGLLGQGEYLLKAIDYELLTLYQARVPGYDEMFETCHAFFEEYYAACDCDHMKPRLEPSLIRMRELVSARNLGN
ncbi:MAG: hypothetical protein ACKVQS_06495 [Fimbriimonadaceae bacterium]